MLSATLPLLGFWAYVRIGGDPPVTRENVQNDLRECLDEWFGDLAPTESRGDSQRHIAGDVEMDRDSVTDPAIGKASSN